MEETFRLKTPHVAIYFKDPLGKKKNIYFGNILCAGSFRLLQTLA